MTAPSSAMPARRRLFLGGTGEAAALAGAALAKFGTGLRVTSSLAGRTSRPAALAGEVRAGGFGGAAGLARYLADAGVHMVTDAPPPFPAADPAHSREGGPARGGPRPGRDVQLRLSHPVSGRVRSGEFPGPRGIGLWRG